MELFMFVMRLFEVFCSALTGFSLLAIAIHEIWGSNGWRARGKGE
jgi:hypothetical protein